MNVDTVFGATGIMARAISGYEVRRKQLDMARLIEQVVSHDEHAVIEGPTGVGKSYAYAAPAILDGRVTVISTANKTLQAQLVEKDLPALRRILGLDFTFALAKGRTNYLCPLAFDKPTNKRALQLSNPELYAWAIGYLAHGEHDGDLDTAPSILTMQEREAMSAPRRCNPKDCSWATRGQCPYQNAKNARDAADIIVTNHALLALSIGNLGILPQAHTLIVDECHQLEGYAVGMESTAVSPYSFRGLYDEIQTMGRAWTARLYQRWLGKRNDTEVGLPENYVDREGVMLADAVRRVGLGQLEESDIDKYTELSRAIENVALVPAATFVRSIERRGQGPDAYAIAKRTAFDVSDLLHDLSLHYESIVFTSATIATGSSNKFGFFREQNGVTYDAHELQLDSPFDFETQAATYLPVSLPTPKGENLAEFDAAARQEIMRLVQASDGGALILFTSTRAMVECAHYLRSNGWPNVRVQGEDQKQNLIQWLKDTPRAALCATSSFWEGVDIPGDALRLVIIDKIPFAPLTPVEIARQAKYGKAAFAKLTVPEATLHLRQGYGRLIRSQSDHGVVAILDPRLSSKGYGKTIRRALPNARTLRYLRDVSDFFTAEVSYAR